MALPPLTPEQFARAAGLELDQLADCVQFGLLATDTDGRHPAADLPIARAAAGLARHGIEPRHLRVYRSGVEREAGLVDSDRRGTWVYYRLVPAALAWLAGLLEVGNLSIGV